MFSSKDSGDYDGKRSGAICEWFNDARNCVFTVFKRVSERIQNGTINSFYEKHPIYPQPSSGSSDPVFLLS